MIELRELKKSYPMGNRHLEVLKGITLNINSGEMVSIMGPSGSGKSTLLNILGILDGYDSGEYILDGNTMLHLSARQAARYRNRLLGFVFQSFNLLPFKNALDNVALPLQYQKCGKKEREHRSLALLERVGLLDWRYHMPNELSGGQKQRVAIARALVTQPRVILADEPTGALDSITSGEIMKLFTELNGQGMTTLIVTHDPEVARASQRIIRLRDGKVDQTL